MLARNLKPKKFLVIDETVNRAENNVPDVYQDGTVLIYSEYGLITDAIPKEQFDLEWEIVEE